MRKVYDFKFVTMDGEWVFTAPSLRSAKIKASKMAPSQVGILCVRHHIVTENEWVLVSDKYKGKNGNKFYWRDFSKVYLEYIFN